MKKILYIILILPLTLFGQKITVTVKPIGVNTANTYLEVADSKVVNAEWYGLSASNTDVQNYTIIQNLINNTNYNTVIIGNDTTEVYLISQPIILRSNMTLTINGYLKIKNGTESIVTDTIPVNTIDIPVVSSSGFAVGEWVSISDTAQTEYFAKDYGFCSKIASINGNVITLTENTGVHAYSENKAAYLGHTQSVIIGQDVENVIVNGTGIVDGNQSNQSQINGLINGSVFQETRNGCGIVFLHSKNIVIEGLTFKNALLHNININGNNGTTTTMCENVRINNVRSYAAHDKNCHIRYAKKVWVTNSSFEGALYEDGLIFYVHCYDVFCDNLILKDNPRAGLYWNSAYDSCLTGSNIQTSGNLYGIYLVARRVNLTNLIIQDNIYISNSYLKTIDINLSNVQIFNSTNEFQLYFGGAVQRVNINNLTISDCSGTAIRSQTISEGTPTNINIIGGGIYNHTGTAENLDVGTDIDYTAFDGITP